jgi:CRISPR-associated endonuclease Csn1
MHMMVFGIDAGIASVGWAVIEAETAASRIVASGTWMFDTPETAKERTPTNAVRRQKRGQRRVIRRRHQRMTAIRQLLAANGLLTDAGRQSLALRLDPWALRAAALERVLAPAEMAAVLGHIGKHRGFRSNAKQDAGANAPDETSKMKIAIEATRQRLGQWRTVGQMFALDMAFADRKRNRGGGFARSLLRSDQEDEVRVIFREQRRLGNPAATEDLERAFSETAFSQRPLQDAELLVGPCPFVSGERRAAKRSYAFERFRLLSRLTAMKITVLGAGERRLTPEEIARAAEDFGAKKQLTYGWLRKRLDLDGHARFADVGREEEAKRDFVARSGNAAEGTWSIRQAVGPAGWRSLLAHPAALDDIAAILSFRSDLGRIRAGIEALPIEAPVAQAIAAAAEAGAFSAFSGAGHVSAAAARALLPHLARGLVYSEACAEAGFDHAARPEVNLDDVRNPVARKAVSELTKQVKAMVQQFGLPDRIHVELARDIGKSAEERDEISRGIEKRNRERDRGRERFAELIGRPPSGMDEMLRFELWSEQLGRCLYTDQEISPRQLVGGDNSVQVDHILPWSRFGDDSFNNKTLCLAGANAAKRGRTPFEWFTEDKTADELAAFERRVESCMAMKRYKKRGHYLRRNAQEVEESFRNRNLGDTRYATRLALGMLARLYPADGKRHVLARPGALTSKLRRGWGLEGLKKDVAGVRRQDDRHHALDAIIVAACSESMLASLTHAFQRSEKQGRARDFSALDLPWEGFREQAVAAFEGVFVARAERHRARGEAHAATIRQVRERDGKMVVFERKAVEALTLKDLDRVKDADRNGAIISSIRAWIEAGKPKAQELLPRSHKGDVMRKVRLASKDKVAVAVRGGTADRGDMARVDLFRKDDAKGRPRYYLVPIYPHEVATLKSPPARAVDAYKDEAEWTPIDGSFSFLFSLYGHSYVEIAKPDGEVVTGYFKGLDRSVGAISLAGHENLKALKSGLGVRTLLTVRKFQVDRLGRRYEVKSETRTWRGAACT